MTQTSWDHKPPINSQRFHRIHHHQREDPSPYPVVKLRFPIRENYLGTEDRQLSLKCTASITDLYWRSTEVNMFIRPRHGWMFPTSNRAEGIAGLQENFQKTIYKFVLILAMMSVNSELIMIIKLKLIEKQAIM